MFKTFEEAQAMIRKGAFRMIDLKFSDFRGRWHHVTIAASQFTGNLMRDGVGYGYINELAFHYIGGILKHGAALLAITNPSTNSYRRFVPGFEAPISAIFSPGIRSAAIRVPKHADQEDTARFEFRPPDASCNVYLALAAQLMEGLDGIAKRIDPTNEGFGPVT